MQEKSLYDRLGGIFAIAAVVDHFSDALIKNPIVGQQSANPALREWHNDQLGRLPGAVLFAPLALHGQGIEGGQALHQGQVGLGKVSPGLGRHSAAGVRNAA